MTNLTDLITKFVNSNSAFTSSSGTLPSNIIANPRSDLKAITTRSGVSYDGPQIPPSPSFLPKVVKNEPEVTKDIVNPTNNGNTEDVQPHVVQSESLIHTSKLVTSSISKPAIAPVSASKPNPKASIPYPSRRINERNHETANNQIEKFYQIFKDMSFEISFADALILMPKFSSTLKALTGNKEKLSMAECLALADLGASINLRPFFVWKRLTLLYLTPTCMTLELANHSISHSVGVAEDVYVKVGSFYFSADFVVVDFDADPRVPLILGRSFLKNERALIDVFEDELTLRVDVFLAIEDEPTSSGFYQPYLDPKGDILLLEAFLSTNTSTFGISPDVAELKDMVKALLLDKKSQNQAPATVKAVEKSCVTYGGAHSYHNCPSTDGNVYRDNIQEFISQASAVNYNQGNTSYRPLMMSNQIRPLGFPPVPNNQNVQLNQRNNQNRFNQNRGNNFNQGPVYQPLSFQPPAYQAHAYQAPAPQTQGVSKEDFLAASTSNSGTLPSNTIANSRSDLKVVENEPEATKDTVHPTNNESTEDVQPPVVQSKSPILTSELVNSPTIEPVNSPVSAPRPNLRPSIRYPSRMQDQKLHDKANDECEKFFQIFKDLNFNISFLDALILMPKFGPSVKSLLTNKDKLCELARTPLNEHCLAVLLKKLLEKLGDPGKFLIPCDFPRKAQCLALVDLGASINLMPLSMWNKLSFLDSTPTCMNLELADCSISCPFGVAEDVYVKVGLFYFPADFVVVDFDADPRVPLILGRSFLKTERALIDVFKGELTLRVGKKAITFNLDQTSRCSANYNDMKAKRIDVINMACKEYSDFLLEEVDAFLAIEDDPTSPEVDQSYLDPERDILLLEAFLNDDPSLPPPNQGNYLPEVRKELKVYEAKSDKSSID
nr:reverse transcriptase domain-containing protein [Tanacetum cinerariifolium]